MRGFRNISIFSVLLLYSHSLTPVAPFSQVSKLPNVGKKRPNLGRSLSECKDYNIPKKSIIPFLYIFYF